MKTMLLQILMPIDLHRKLEQLAQLDRRSKTSEALVILEEEIAIRTNGKKVSA